MKLNFKFGQKAKQPDSDAVWGDTFQTCAFRQPLMPQLGEFYLKAKRLQGEWTVFRVAEMPAVFSAGGTVIENKTEKSGLGFTAAMTYLANFENTTGDLRYQAVNVNEKTGLGFRHYEAFGHREGIIFDRDGRLHRTVDGDLVTDGMFTKEEMTLFEARNKLAREQLRTGIGDNGMLWASMPQNAVAGDAVALAEESIAFAAFIKPLKEAAHIWREWRKGGDGRSKEAWQNIYKKLTEAEKNIGLLKIVDKSDLKKGMNIFALFQAIHGAQVNYLNKSKIFSDFVRDVKNELTKLKLPGDAADVLMLQDPAMDGEDLPLPVRGFFDYCDQLQQQLATAIAAKKSGIALPAPEKKLLPSPVLK